MQGQLKTDALVAAKRAGFNAGLVSFSDKLVWVAGDDGRVELLSATIERGSRRIKLYLSALTARSRDVGELIVKLKEWDESEHPRDEDGKFTFSGGGAEFVSPSVASDHTLHSAVAAIGDKQHQALKDATAFIDNELNLKGTPADAVGAWQDGAENTTVDFHPSSKWTDWDRIKLAASMKGHIADQKSVLVFQEQKHGDGALLVFEAKGDLASIHQNLLSDGVAFHTLVPHDDGATVYAAVTDPKEVKATVAAVDKAAERYDSKVEVYKGRAEFIGDAAGSGSDREQRDRARAAYEGNIRQSPIHNADAVWARVRDRWGAAADQEVAAKRFRRDHSDVDWTKDPQGLFSGSIGHALEGSLSEHPATISSANVTATGRSEADRASLVDTSKVYQQPSLALMKKDPEAFDRNMTVFRGHVTYPNFRPADLKGGADAIAQHVSDQIKSNLRFLYQHAPAEIKARGPKWYGGANRIARDWADKYKLKDASVTGVIAALSPQKEWNSNVSLAQRVIDIQETKKDVQWDAAMSAKAKELWHKGQDKLASDKKLGELTDPVARAIWIRTYDETHGDRSYRAVDPEGNFGETVKTKEGKGPPAKAAWQATPAIVQAIQCLDADGNRHKIGAVLSPGNNKVRSFYNNILDPHSKNNDVTIDTHAVGAALLCSPSSNSAMVAHNFGLSPEKADQPSDWKSVSNSTRLGVKGLYGLYADAYRDVAKEVGLEPNQLQAVVWEAKLSLFGELTNKQYDEVEAAWRDYGQGKQTLEQTQAKVVEIAGGFHPLLWQTAT